MNKAKFTTELASLIHKHASMPVETKTAISGVSCFTARATDAGIPTVYNPSLCIIAQGSKELWLEKEHFTYGPSQFLTISVDLPVMGHITKASVDKPYLCLKIDIDVYLLSELLVRDTSDASRQSSFNGRTLGLFVGEVDGQMADTVLRLARLLDTPDEISVMAPLIMRELHYRLLRSQYAGAIAQLFLQGSSTQGVTAAIRKMKSGFRERWSIETLAQTAGMSSSSFHAHFKKVTGMSPLQYLKRLRLFEARQLMLVNKRDASSTAYEVGYESPSQFNREYVRLFGLPPATDVKKLLDAHSPIAEA